MKRNLFAVFSIFFCCWLVFFYLLKYIKNHASLIVRSIILITRESDCTLHPMNFYQGCLSIKSKFVCNLWCHIFYRHFICVSQFYVNHPFVTFCNMSHEWIRKHITYIRCVWEGERNFLLQCLMREKWTAFTLFIFMWQV